MGSEKHDIIIIGSGPAGYVAAIRAAQLGMNTACIERFPSLGGTCLNVGCIPSKSLLESSERFHEASNNLSEFGIDAVGVTPNLGAMMARKETVVANLTKGVQFLFKKNRITRYLGKARLKGDGMVLVEGGNGEEMLLEARSIVIATGSKPSTIPGVFFDKDRIGSSTEALSYRDVPKRLVVIGAGVIGLELGSVWKRMGSEVVVVEYMDRVLPEMDSDISKNALRFLKRQKIDFELNAKVSSARVEGETCIVEVEGKGNIEADRILVATGRKPRTEGLGLENAGIELTKNGRIKVDDDFKTTAEGIYAVGDVIGGAMLAHKASHEGTACVERIAGLEGNVDYGIIPSVVYLRPEIAAVGKTETQLIDNKTSYKKGTYSFKGNGRAMAHGLNDGFVKVLAAADTGEILGAHVMGPWAGELIGQVSVAMAGHMTTGRFAHVCAAHPTLTEGLREAMLAVDGEAIHV